MVEKEVEKVPRGTSFLYGKAKKIISLLFEILPNLYILSFKIVNWTLFLLFLTSFYFGSHGQYDETYKVCIDRLQNWYISVLIFHFSIKHLVSLFILLHFLQEDTKRHLTKLGREQAHLTGKRLAEIVNGINEKFQPCNVKTIRVSNMTRAKETASIISEYLPKENIVRDLPDPLLNEGM